MTPCAWPASSPRERPVLALDEVAEQHDVTTLARLADSFRVGVRYGTRMAVLSEQSMQLRRAWFASYREGITRAPILLTIPALLFFVGPLLGQQSGQSLVEWAVSAFVLLLFALGILAVGE